MPMRPLLPLLFLSFSTALSAQTIYSCTDAAGGKVITTSRDYTNCKPVSKSGDAGGGGGAASSSGGRPKATATPTPSDFPRVNEGAQKARDNDRRHILEQELATERRQLEQARRELAEQEAVRPAQPAERLLPYRDRIGQHERNVQAIQKELSGLR